MELSAQLAAAVPGCGAEQYECASGTVLVVEPEQLLAVLRFLKQDPGQDYNVLVDLTAVDRVATEGVIEVVYLLRSIAAGRRLMVKTRLAGEPWTLASATPLWGSANWAEREAWDMFGLRFTGHPDLRRILMYEEFEGYPLRKDYPYNKRQPLVEERDPIANPWPGTGNPT